MDLRLHRPKLHVRRNGGSSSKDIRCSHGIHPEVLRFVREQRNGAPRRERILAAAGSLVLILCQSRQVTHAALLHSLVAMDTIYPTTRS